MPQKTRQITPVSGTTALLLMEAPYYTVTEVAELLKRYEEQWRNEINAAQNAVSQYYQGQMAIMNQNFQQTVAWERTNCQNTLNKLVCEQQVRQAEELKQHEEEVNKLKREISDLKILCDKKMAEYEKKVMSGEIDPLWDRYLHTRERTEAEKEALAVQFETRIEADIRHYESFVTSRMSGYSNPIPKLRLAERTLKNIPQRSFGYYYKARVLADMERKEEALQVSREGIRMTAHSAEARENTSLWRMFHFLFCPPRNLPGKQIAGEELRFPADVLGRILEYAGDLPRLRTVSSHWQTAVLQYTSFLRRPKFRTYMTTNLVKEFVGLCQSLQIFKCEQIHLVAEFDEEISILRVFADSGILVDDLAINVPSSEALLSLLESSETAARLFAHVTVLNLTIDCVTTTSQTSKLTKYFSEVVQFRLRINALLPLGQDGNGSGSIVTVTDLPKLKSLEVSCDEMSCSGSDFVQDYLSANQCPNLESFATDFLIENFETISSVFTPTLKTLWVVSPECSAIVTLERVLVERNVRLETLIIWGNGAFGEQHDFNPAAFCHLHSLHFEKIYMKTEVVEKMIAATEGNLEELTLCFQDDSIHSSSHFSGDTWATVIPQCPHLRSLTCYSQVSPEDLQHEFRDAMENSEAAQCLEELTFVEQEGNVTDADLSVLFGEQPLLPSLKRVSGVRERLSDEMIQRLETELGLEVR